MQTHRFLNALIVLSALLLLPSAFPRKGASYETPPEEISLSGNDRILIIAPHPDDEAIGCAGIIQEGVRLGAAVKVLYITEGEHNPVALFAYRKRVFLKSKKEAYIELGRVRTGESVEAARLLGLKREELTFLDYPDSGITKIFTGHWKEGNEFRDSLTGLERAARGEGARPLAPYLGGSILDEVKAAISDFRPTLIFSPSPLDEHTDHIGSYLFLEAALLELKNILPRPEVYLYIAHYRHWPQPAGLYPEEALLPPEGLRGAFRWFAFALNPRQRAAKKNAIMKFESQVKYRGKYLLSFARANELFSEEMRALHLKKGRGYPLKGRGGVKEASFYYDGDRLDINIDFSKRIPNHSRINGTLYLLGHRMNTAFRDMPKIKIGFRSGKWAVYEEGDKIGKDGITFIFKGGTLRLSVPLSLLGEPHSVFYSHDINFADGGRNGRGPWRLLTLEPRRPK